MLRNFGTALKDPVTVINECFFHDKQNGFYIFKFVGANSGIMGSEFRSLKHLLQ